MSVEDFLQRSADSQWEFYTSHYNLVLVFIYVIILVSDF